MTDNTAINITGILIGGLLGIIFTVYLTLSLAKKKTSIGPHGMRLFAGIFALILGVIMGITWLYWLITRWTSFESQASILLAHVLTEGSSAALLIISGIGMIRGWTSGPGLYLIANGLLLFTTLHALLSYGAKGHPLLMNGIAIVLTIVSGYMMALVYGWEHFVIHLDEAE
jgi:hypothetical protein